MSRSGSAPCSPSFPNPAPPLTLGSLKLYPGSRGRFSWLKFISARSRVLSDRVSHGRVSARVCDK